MTRQNLGQSFTMAIIGYGTPGQERFITALNRAFALHRPTGLVPYQSYLQDREERVGWSKWRSSPHIRYTTEGGDYIYHYYADYDQAAKYLILGGKYSPPLRMDAIILLVNAQEGLLPEADRYLTLVYQLQTPKLFVWINRGQSTDEREMAEKEQLVFLRLARYVSPEMVIPLIPESLGDGWSSFPGDTPTAWDRGFRMMLNLVESTLLPSVPFGEQPFLLPIEDRLPSDSKWVVFGRVWRGKVSVGERVELIKRGGGHQEGVIQSLRTFDRTLEGAVLGENVGCLVNGVDLSQGEQGDILAAPETIQASKTVQGAFYLHAPGEGMPGTEARDPVRDGAQVSCSAWCEPVAVAGTMRFPKKGSVLWPGSYAECLIELVEATPLEVGFAFSIRDVRRKTIGTCLVTSLR